MKPSLRATFLLILVSLGAGACAPRTTHRIEGRTMGTTYRVAVVTSRPDPVTSLQEMIDLRLEGINLSLSTYSEASEISRFNRLSQVGEEFPISGDFFRVMTTAREIFELSEGAWDGTVRPLVDAWGFGPAGPRLTAPSTQQIAEALDDVGFDKIEITDSRALVKRHAAVTLDLSSIAKGYGVDAVAEVVRREGFHDFLVEIGGEVRAFGARRDGRPWRVGINRPDPGASPDEVYKVVPLQNQGLATSGDYRSYFLEDGVRRSHVIDPRTGHPVANGVVSASVLAPDCMRADGLATAVMVMGAKAGIALIERLPNVEALVLVARPGGELEEYRSSGFRTEPSGQ